ncbi:sirohydrochlorin chelatase [Priestia megaterium]|nr:sirohydrochlorin chelatase [Priestia megaterium]
MDAVLYICHGSRIKEGCTQAIEFIERCKKTIDIPIQELCFLELAPPTIEQGFERCIKQGATRIAVVPVLLLTATHAKKDIPEEIQKVHRHYPQVEVVYGEPFGVDNKIVDILMERIHQTNVSKDKDAMVLLVGRGSSDPMVKQDLNEIADRLRKKAKFQRVETCYLAATKPTLTDGLKQAQETAHTQVFVLPYLLFTGVLMNEIKEQLAKLGTTNQQFILTDYLGYHDGLAQILKLRVHQLLSDKGNRYNVYRYA